MAGGQERVLRRRIRSVQSTKKITRAMELIAASRIVKAQHRVAAARPYAERITEVIGSLARGGAASSPLLVQRESVSKVAIVAITADRGLAGAYNSTVIRAAERAVRAAQAEGKSYALICVGRKGQSYFRFRGFNIEASFTGFSEQPGYEDARTVASFVRERFESGEYDVVDVAYTQFLSAGTQRVVTRRLMPIDPAIIEAASAGAGSATQHEFEPDAEAILTSLLPRYAESRLFAAFLDASASELAARQRAMKSATDNADELITRLTRQMNRARQDSITTEIMEIVGGAEALRQSGADESDYLADHVIGQELFIER